jgi:pyrroloquinoline quinone biosynthesis protein D
MQRRSQAESFVKLNARPAFGKGVRLRLEPDGTAMLLVPEGALVLNGSAAAALDLIDGRRTVADIITCLVQRFDIGEEDARTDVGSLFDRLVERQTLRSL